MKMKELENKLAQLKEKEQEVSQLREELGLTQLVEVEEKSVESSIPSKEWIENYTVKGFFAVATLEEKEKVKIKTWWDGKVIEQMNIEYFSDKSELEVFLLRELCSTYLQRVWSKPSKAQDYLPEFRIKFREAKRKRNDFFFYTEDETAEDVFWTYPDL